MHTLYIYANYAYLYRKQSLQLPSYRIIFQPILRVTSQIKVLSILNKHLWQYRSYIEVYTLDIGKGNECWMKIIHIWYRIRIYSRQKHISKKHRTATKGLITILKSDTLIWVKTPEKVVLPVQTSPAHIHIYIFSECPRKTNTFSA